MGVRVLIVDNLALVRQGVVVLLRQAPDLEVVGQAGDAAETLDRACRLSPDVILLDIRMPGGIELIRTLRARCPGASTLVLTDDGDPETATRAVEAGAVGYVLKDIAPADLVNAIRYAADGQSMVHPRITRHLLGQLALARRSTSKDAARSRGLSDREIDVLERLGEGLKDREIARALSVSEATVKTHLRAIYRKLGVRNRAQAAAFAASHGLTWPPPGA